SDRRWPARGSRQPDARRLANVGIDTPTPFAPRFLRSADGRVRRGTGSGSHRRRRLHRVLPVLRLSFPPVLGGGIGLRPESPADVPRGQYLESAGLAPSDFF